MQGGGSGAHARGRALRAAASRSSLGRPETVGTSMNALAHCAEALYVEGRNAEADEHALAGRAADR